MAEEAEAPAWSPGRAVDRYIVLRSIGAGGCGEVLAAFDPVLDRNVALKLLRGEGSRAAALLREARALAKVNHPNIVAIYDAGVADDHPFLAMELVSGSDLHTWLRQDPRPNPPQALELLLQAGSGLAAAHEAGIVHGDIKPANILVGDGQALVTDFGVAVWDAAEGEDDDAPPKLVGTPAFMAPEQYSGARADPLSDQFSFCQTAWEALFGGAAYRVTTAIEYTEGESSDQRHCGATSGSGTSAAEIAALEDAKRSGPPSAPAGHGIARRVVEALQRGMHPDPGARWPSMQALLDVLAHDPSQQRRWWLAGGGALALTVAASAATALWVAPDPPCQGAAEALGDPAGERLDAVETALRGADPIYDDARTYAVDTLRSHADAWQAMHTEACEATAVRGEQSEAMLDLRMQCLTRARERLDAISTVLIDGGADGLPRAHRLVGGLRPLSRCADVEALEAEVPPPEDPELRAAVDAVHVDLARLEAEFAAGQQADALQGLPAVVQRARALEHPSTLGEVLRVYGNQLEGMGEYETAATQLEEAFGLGLEHGPTRTAIAAAGELAFLYSTDIPDLAKADVYGTMAVSLARRDHRGSALEAAMITDLSAVEMARGNIEASERLDRTALELRKAAFGPNHPTIAEVLENLAGSLSMLGDFEEAEALNREALAILIEHLGERHPTVAGSRVRLAQTLHALGGRSSEVIELLERARVDQEATLGKTHPEISWTLTALGEAYDDVGRWDEGLRALSGALEIRETAFGPDHPDVAGSLNSVAAHHLQAGDERDAESMLRRSIEIYERTLGPDQYPLSPMVMNLGVALLLQGKYNDARPQFERALTLVEDNVGKDHPQTILIHLNLGKIELETDNLPAARSAFERALAVGESTLGPEHASLVKPLLMLGRTLRQQSETNAAREALTRARAIGKSAELQLETRGDVEFELAQLDGDAEAARRAREHFAQAGEMFAEDVKAVDAWLGVHAG
jgi:tetratricopeptide (TPR) repeat protein/predicted Ser/Thr protein kinase